MATDEISTRFSVPTTPVIPDVTKVSSNSHHEKHKEEKDEQQSPPREKDSLEISTPIDEAGKVVSQHDKECFENIVKSPPQIGGKLNIVLR